MTRVSSPIRTLPPGADNPIRTVELGRAMAVVISTFVEPANTIMFVRGPIEGPDAGEFRRELDRVCGSAEHVVVDVADVAPAETALVRMLVALRLRTAGGSVHCRWSRTESAMASVPLVAEAQLELSV